MPCDQSSLRDGVLNGALDVGKMGLDGFAQLDRAVVLGTLDQQVQHLAAVLQYPVGRACAIHKAQDFDLIDDAVGACPIRDGADRHSLTLRDARRADLDGVNAGLDQRLGDDQLLLRRVADAGSLLSVPECRVHDLEVLHSAPPTRPRLVFIMQQHSPDRTACTGNAQNSQVWGGSSRLCATWRYRGVVWWKDSGVVESLAAATSSESISRQGDYTKYALVAEREGIEARICLRASQVYSHT